MSYHLTINPVDPDSVTTLPDPWTSLQAQGFHPDLVARAKGFLAKAKRDGHEELAVQVLDWVGDGFTRRFAATKFLPADTDPHQTLKTQFVQAIDNLSADFGDRVSAVVWESLVFLGTRANPTQEATIRSQSQYLIHPWWLVDASLHAVGKVYGLFMHIQSRVYEQTGMALDHNCDCNHVVYQPQDNGAISIFLPPSRRPQATAALLSHLLSESYLIGAAKYPFEMGLTDEWKEPQTLTY